MLYHTMHGNKSHCDECRNHSEQAVFMQTNNYYDYNMKCEDFEYKGS